MIEKTYRILNKILRISLENTAIIPDEFKRFSCATEEKPDVVVISDCASEEYCCYGIRYLSDGDKKIKNVFFSQKDRGQMLYSKTDDYSRLHLQLDSNCTNAVLSELLVVGFYSHISLQKALLLHASAVYYKKKAVIFTAASGVGKTTQAELWQEHKDAAIMNGDKVFLTKESEKIVAWGSPWNGSSPYAQNIGAEVAAIVVLEQAEENNIRKLSGMELLEKLASHVFIPGWDSRCESAVLDLLDEVLAGTDVYLLRCGPNEDAVTLLENTIF